MTLEEFYQWLGNWIRKNPEHKSQLLCAAAVIQNENEYREYEPGAVVIALGKVADDEGFEKDGELSIGPPNVSKYLM